MTTQIDIDFAKSFLQTLKLEFERANPEDDDIDRLQDVLNVINGLVEGRGTEMAWETVQDMYLEEQALEEEYRDLEFENHNLKNRVQDLVDELDRRFGI
jgi:hypothetical protein